MGRFWVICNNKLCFGSFVFVPDLRLLLSIWSQQKWACLKTLFATFLQNKKLKNQHCKTQCRISPRKKEKENCNSLVHRIAGFIFLVVCIQLGHSLTKSYKFSCSCLPDFPPLYLLLSYLTPLTYFRWADFEWFATTNFASDLLCLSPTFAYCYQYDLNRNELAWRHCLQLFCKTKNSRINIARHNAEYHREKKKKKTVTL